MTREMTSASMLIPSDPTNQTVVSSSPVAPMPGNSFRASQRRFSLYCGAALITVATVSQTHAQSAPKETPLSVVNALHAAFGQHHDRAVHTKGTILEGTFTPAPEARTIVRTPVFAGGRWSRASRCLPACLPCRTTTTTPRRLASRSRSRR